MVRPAFVSRVASVAASILGPIALSGALSGALLAGAGAADARPAATGWFAEGGLGAVAFLPKASSDAKIGPALDVRIGRDLFSWLGVGIHLAASSHEATVPPPPEGEWF